LQRYVQADDAVDELQQWHAAARAAAGMWAVVGLLLLLLALHITAAPHLERLLPSLLRIVPTMLYAGLVPVLSRFVLRPACHWLNSLEKHSTKVNTTTAYPVLPFVSGYHGHTAYDLLPTLYVCSS
jgi:hypothetical protein